MDDLKDLLARVEISTGPDRELDAAIAVATLGTTSTEDDLIYHKAPARDDRCAPGTYWRKSRSGMSLHTSPPYTSSLDAALALVEEKLPGNRLHMSNRALDHEDNLVDRPSCCLWHDSLAEKSSRGSPWCEGDVHEGATLPLAVLSALLRALISQKEPANV
jgi:hypothetical protein